MKIILELTDNNAIIKNIESVKDNGLLYKKVDAYLLDNNDSTNFDNNKKFLNDLIKDLGLYTGNIYEKNNLVIKNDYGEKYEFTLHDLKLEHIKLKSKMSIIEKALSLTDIDNKKILNSNNE